MSNSKVIVKAEDTTKFPMISLTDVPFDIMWLPFTRIQLEFFLSEVNDLRFDANWYANVVSKGNPRTSPNRMKRDNINGILTTNVLLTEIRRIADWFGHHEGHVFDLPTAEEWGVILDVSRTHSVISLDDLPPDTDSRARILLQRLEEINSASNLANQMMLGWGFSEYVYRDNSRQTCQIAGGRQGELTSLIESREQVGDRQPYLTFRLIRRAL